MTWNPEISSINQKIQFGAEATTALGTSVAANKLLQCFDFVFTINSDVQYFAATGRKYDSVAIENSEWVTGAMTGDVDYSGLIYPLASAFGSVSPVAHLASATAKDWIFTPPVTGSIVPQTYTIEQGDTIRAHKFTYGLFTDFGYSGDRHKFSCTASLIGQPIQDAITMTASPTAIAIAPAAAKHFNVYMDPTSAALGTTMLNRVMNIDFKISNLYGGFYPFNRADIGWTAHVDLNPQATFKLMVEADTQGMALLTSMQAGTTQFIRVDGQGLQIASDGPGAIFNEFKHDMAVKVSKASAYQDKEGIYAIEWEMNVVEDATWGHSQMLTLTNLVTAL